LPRSGAVAAKRVRLDGTIASMGTFVIHPKGCHEFGAGLHGDACRFPEECDAFSGGVAAIDAEAFACIDGEAALAAPLGAIEIGLRLRAEDLRVVTTPAVVAIDDAELPDDGAARVAFCERWGFDWRAADLDTVRRRHAGTGLLWNVRLHGRAMPYEKYARRGDLHWTSYRDAAPYRQRADHLAGLVRTLGGDGPILDLGCGDGLFSSLFAADGAVVHGLDPQPEAIAIAEARTGQQTFPAAGPRFQVGSGERLPFPDATFRAVALLDVIEHLDNPVRTLREIERVLTPGGALLVTTPEWQYGASSDPTYHGFEFTMEELARLVESATRLAVTDQGRVGGVYRDLVVVARR
ncbi:MAG: class I SAM-dependent methyltransferase, partial [Phycisphaerales bacterium]|nr:class I SAM-dependent methyltransferase [Phycisphaerales bacterium]